MRRALLAAMVAALALSVAAFAAGLTVPGFACVSSGFACLSIASRRARPKNWTRADNHEQE